MRVGRQFLRSPNYPGIISGRINHATGGGVPPGSVLGATDQAAAYPVRDAVAPSDIVATFYRLLGVDPHLTINDLTGRPLPIAHGGQPIHSVLA